MQHFCFDIDDTITYAPAFFRHLIGTLSSANISIVTFREDKEDTEQYLANELIRFDQLFVSSDPEYGKQDDQSLHQWKADLVNNVIKPDIFFEDMPEVVGLIDPSIIVFMPCDSVIREWIQSKV